MIRGSSSNTGGKKYWFFGHFALIEASKPPAACANCAFYRDWVKPFTHRVKEDCLRFFLRYHHGYNTIYQKPGKVGTGTRCAKIGVVL